LPDELLNVTVYWGRSNAVASDANINQNVTTGSYNLNQSSGSKSSASINGDIYFKIKQGFKGSLPGYQHIFFIKIDPAGRVEQKAILDVLNNFEQFGQQTIPPRSGGEGVVSIVKKYKPWPYIQAITENLVLISGGKSKTKNVSRSQSVSINGFASGQGAGDSFDVDVSARSVNIPQTLHGPITITESYIGNSFPSDLTPTSGVRPQKLEVTKAVVNGVLQNAPKFPTGNYLYSTNVELYKWGFVKVTAITVEITNSYV
jgi:hypothetical protein